MTDPLSKLPLIATDREIAVALVGKAPCNYPVPVMVFTSDR